MHSVTDLFKKQLLFVTGKGGVGKTFLSLQLARKAASLGKKVLLAEVAGVGHLPPLMGAGRVEHREQLLAENLSYISLDPEICLKEYVSESLNLPGLYHKVFSRNVVQSFLRTIPGLYPVMLVGRLYYSCVRKILPSYDLVIFDAPASGHYFQLVSTPKDVAESGLVGPLVGEIRKVLDFIADSEKTGAVYITLPEGLVVSETLEFLESGKTRSPVAPCAFIVNRFFDLNLQRCAWSSGSSLQDSSVAQENSVLNYARTKKDKARKHSLSFGPDLSVSG